MGKDAREPSEWRRIIGEGVSDWWVFPQGDVGYDSQHIRLAVLECVSPTSFQKESKHVLCLQVSVKYVSLPLECK